MVRLLKRVQPRRTLQALAATMFCAVILHPSSTMNTAISTHIPSTIPFFTPLFSSHPGACAASPQHSVTAANTPNAMGR